ncbi:iron-siderophore ABC transporter substrate-binding protein [Streptomyces sp. IBSBF 2435]|uniref:iron-siderophore ABC transporter substrate-binding protein n=1 Tax=Streptomyces sp. IBSBF 2435 TaxID=2903531 RepID=UPI002FDC332C
MSRAQIAARFAGLLASVMLLVGGAAACGSNESGSGSDPDSGAAAGPSATGKASPDAFPVTIAHKYGSTTLKAEPKRIVTVGLTDQDAVLALGTVPVGTTEWLGGYKGAVGPWAQDKLNGAAAPTVLKDTGTGPQMEKIAALRPDLILAVYSGLTKEQYQTLSKFAPVVAQPKEFNDYGVPWQQQTETIGKALGRPAEAASLVDGVEARFAAAKKAHPEFAGATAVMATPYEGTFVYGSQDVRSRLLSGLGLTLPKDLDKVIGDSFGANISKERTDLLDQGVAVWILPDTAAAVTKLHGDKLYGDLNVVRQGREVFVKESSDYGNAVSLSTVLSIPYVLDRLVPQVAAAVDGNPATKVEQPAS